MNALELVNDLEARLKTAKAELALSRKAERAAAKKSPPSVKETALSALREEISSNGWTSKVSNRGGKLYIRINQQLPIDTYIWKVPRNLVEKHFSKAHLTSGGMGEYTFRLNP